MHENQAAVVIQEGDIVAQIIIGIAETNHYGMLWKVMGSDGSTKDQHFAATTDAGDRAYAGLLLFDYIGKIVSRVYVANMRLVVDFIDGASFSTTLR